MELAGSRVKLGRLVGSWLLPTKLPWWSVFDVTLLSTDHAGPGAQWYHITALVEINKQTKRQYQRKIFLFDGKPAAYCEHRIRYCSKEERLSSQV